MCSKIQTLLLKLLQSRVKNCPKFHHLKTTLQLDYVWNLVIDERKIKKDLIFYEACVCLIGLQKNPLFSIELLPCFTLTFSTLAFVIFTFFYLIFRTFNLVLLDLPILPNSQLQLKMKNNK